MSDDPKTRPDETFDADATQVYQAPTEQFLGNYRLVRLIGNGAMGEVYLANHRKFSQREYAIKVIRNEVATEETRRRFEREITAMGGMVHPNLVYASDAGVDESGKLYLVMEYIRGKDLERQLDNNGPLKIPEAMEILSKICLGVAHAHKQGVVHRDIKPSNVMLSDQLEVKVLDLGIASLQSDSATRVTRSEGLMGTLPFIAPELWGDATQASPASDIYAIGCTAYCMCAGSPPFSGDAYRSLTQLMSAHRQSPPPPLHELRPDIPIELSGLILRSLHKDPKRRYQNATDFAASLAPYTKPLTSDDSIFVSKAHPTPIRGTTTRINVDSRGGLGMLAIAFVLLVVAGFSLLRAYLGDTTTPAWAYVFGQLENSKLPHLLGLGIDVIRLLLVVPATFFVLTGYYSNEVISTFFRVGGGVAATVAKVAIVITLTAIAIPLWHYYWESDGLPTRLAESYNAHIEQTPPSERILEKTTAKGQLPPSRWYLGYATVTQALIPCLTIVFPLVWFLVKDLPGLRNRLSNLGLQQAEATFPGELREHLRRFGGYLRGYAGRLLALSAVAVLLIQFNYLVIFTVGGESDRSIEKAVLRITACILAVFLAIIMFGVAAAYLRGYEMTRNKIASIGSAGDEEDLAEIGVGWLVQSLVFRRLGGLVCLSLLLLFGHSAWSMSRTHETQQGIARAKEAANWIPARCDPTDDASLVRITNSLFTDLLYDRIVLNANRELNLELDDPRGRIVFVLIPKTAPSEPDSFYMMEDKVSTELFSLFAIAFPDDIDDDAASYRAESKNAPNTPVRDVTAMDAIAFATLVCDGLLPSKTQWDHAFGRNFLLEDAAERIKVVSNDGPTQNDRPPWPDTSMLAIGESPWGCKQMSWGGFEFTRYDDALSQLFIPHPESDLQLRGWSERMIADRGPLTADSWREFLKDESVGDPWPFPTSPPTTARPDTGFRVIIERSE